jgi:hypothetical protein
MKTLSDDTRVLIETWSDPGDYPNAVAQGPLPSYQYVAGIEGEIKVELTWEEYQQFLEAESLQFWMHEVFDYEYPDGVCSAEWQHRVHGVNEDKKPVALIIWADEVEADPNYRGPEPPED